MTVRIEHGNMLEVLGKMVAEGATVQSVVTDPPYHLQSIVKRFANSPRTEASMPSAGPTVKPVDLMRWLVRLITPPGGTVLDPFAGSGTTGMACMAEGFDAILIEREAEYVADIRRRLAHVRGDDTPLFERV